MSLTLVFRIQAVMSSFFGFMMLNYAGAMMAMLHVVLGKACLFIGMAYLSWQMPSWASDNLKSVGMFFAILHAVWIPLTLFQISQGLFPSDMENILGNIGLIILAGNLAEI